MRFRSTLCAAVIGLSVALSLSSRIAESQMIGGPIGVVLDKASFPAASYAAMQSTADRVAAIVNQLIPGIPNGYNQPNVVCFWGTRPITVVGPPRLPGEPTDRPIGEIRISVAHILPADEQMLAFQLAHELTHVKMGPTNDNYLVEMFAVAVSLEVLKRYPFPEQLTREFTDPKVGFDVAWPPYIRAALYRRDDVQLEAFWQSQVPRQQQLNSNDWDYSLSALGSLVVASHGSLVWANLLNISDLSTGCVRMRADTITFNCQPNINKLLKREPVLKSLGYLPA